MDSSLNGTVPGYVEHQVTDVINGDTKNRSIRKRASGSIVVKGVVKKEKKATGGSSTPGTSLVDTIKGASGELAKALKTTIDVTGR